MPIVNENDTVTINRLKFGDNDTLSAKVAGLVDSDLLIILSDIDGLYSADPRQDPNAKLVPHVGKSRKTSKNLQEIQEVQLEQAVCARKLTRSKSLWHQEFQHF